MAFMLDETAEARALAEACGFADIDMPNLRVDMPDVLKLAVERENLAVAALHLDRAVRHARHELKVRDGGRRLAGLGLRWPDKPWTDDCRNDLWVLAWGLNAALADGPGQEPLEELTAREAEAIRNALDSYGALIEVEPEKPWVLPLCRDALDRWRRAAPDEDAEAIMAAGL